MGLSLAKYGEITLKNGRVEQRNFNDYPVVRHDESPTVTNTYIVENSIDVLSSGVGEPGVPPFAPALCNAIFCGDRQAHPLVADRQSAGVTLKSAASVA